MKRLIYVISAIAALLCVSCSRTEQPKTPAGANTVKIAPTMSDFSKATDTDFEVGDEISISAYRGEIEWFSNAKYTLTETGWQPETPIQWYEGADDATFVGIYPYSAVDFIDEKGIVTVNSDQSTHELLTKSDLMRGSAVTGIGKEVKIAFTHALSKIRINIYNQSTSDIQEVVVGNVFGQIDAATGELYGNPAPIKACRIDANTYEVIVAPQTIAPKLYLKSGEGVAYECDVLDSIEFAEGAAKAANVTIKDGHTSVEFSDDIIGWNADPIDNFSKKFSFEYDITATSGSITATPKYLDKYFFWDISPISYIEGQDMQYYAQNSLDYYKDMCDSYEVEIVGTFIFIGEPNTYEYDLTPETEYGAYACYCTPEAKVISYVETDYFSTPEIEKIDFSAVVEWDNPNATITITPSIDDQKYVFDYATEEYLQSYYEGSAEEYLAELIWLYDLFGLLDEICYEGVFEDQISPGEGVNHAMIVAVSGAYMISDIIDETFTFEPVKEPYSSLEGDVDITTEFENATLSSCVNYGNAMGADSYIRRIIIGNVDKTKQLYFFVCSDLTSTATTGLAGTYTLEPNETFAPWTSPAGYAIGTTAYNNGYFTLDDRGYSMDPWCSMTEGTITITAVETEGKSHKIELDVKDCKGNKITGSFEIDFKTISGAKAEDPATKANFKAITPDWTERPSLQALKNMDQPQSANTPLKRLSK